MTNKRWIWPIVLMVSTIAVLLVNLTGWGQSLRPVIALWFLCFCPGMAFIRLLPMDEGYVQVTLAIMFSLVLDILVAGVLVYAGAWSAEDALLVLAGLCAAGVMGQVGQLLVRRRHLPPHAL